jgi:hypothetical protein
MLRDQQIIIQRSFQAKCGKPSPHKSRVLTRARQEFIGTVLGNNRLQSLVSTRARQEYIGTVLGYTRQQSLLLLRRQDLEQVHHKLLTQLIRTKGTKWKC